jgi:hypothetical protein
VASTKTPASGTGGSAGTSVRFVAAPEAPPLAQAASLALAITRHCGLNTFPEVLDRLDEIAQVELPAVEDAVEEAGPVDPTLLPQLQADLDDFNRRFAALDLDQDDLDLLIEHAEVIAQLTVRPLVTVAVCPECDDWILVSKTVPSTCTLTTGCKGKPVKASILAKEKPPVVDDPEPPESVQPDLAVEVRIAVSTEGDVAVEVAS